MVTIPPRRRRPLATTPGSRDRFLGTLVAGGSGLKLSGLKRAGLEQCAQAGSLARAGHAAASLDGVTDAADPGGVAVGDSNLKRCQTLVKIRDDSGIYLPHRGLGHQLAKLGQGL